MADADVFREVAIGEMDVWKGCFHLIIDEPSKNAHLGGISKPMVLSFDLVFLLCAVDKIMAGLAKRDQVLRAVPASLAALDVMDIEDGVFRLALTPLTAMLIAPEDILAHIPEVQLWSLLVLHSFDSRMLDFLNIELGDLDSGLADRKQVVSQANGLDVGIYLVLHGRGQPAFGLPPVPKPGLAISRLTTAPGSSKLLTGCQEFLDIRSWGDFCLKQDDLLSGC